MSLSMHPHDNRLRELILPETEESIFSLYKTLPALAAEQEYGIENEVVILDTETTGLFDSKNRITEIALIRMRGVTVLEKYSQLINPGMPIPPEITEITGISDELVADAPRIFELDSVIRDFLGDADIVAHNASFDKRFIDAELGFISNNWVDSLRLLRVGLPRLRSYALSNVANWLGVDSPDAHRALADTEMLSYVWRLALSGLSTIQPNVQSALLSLSLEGELDEKVWIERVLNSTGSKQTSFTLSALRRATAPVASTEPKLDAFEQRLSFANKQKLNTFFEELAEQNSSFERRPSQEQMAAAVYDAFEGANTLIAEAPTGVGKSLAYLLPSVLMAKENHMAIGIATKTNALADQLLSQEIPRLRDQLQKGGHAEGDFEYTAVKGYENYFCLRKIEGLLKSKTLAPSNLDHILSWVSQTPASDTSRYVGPQARRSEMVATQAECTKRRCRFYPHLCYIHGARQRAKSSDIVITNHSLLIRDSLSAAKILPPIRYWIVDEAHSFEKETRRQTETRFNGFELARELDAVQMPNSGLLARIAKQIAGKSLKAEEQSELGLMLIEFRQELEKISTILLAANTQSAKAYLSKKRREEYGQSELWIDASLRESELWRASMVWAEQLMFALQDLLMQGRKLISALSLEEAVANSDLMPESNRLLDELGRVTEALNLIFFEPSSDFYYSIYPDSYRNTVSFAAAALEVGPVISSSLVPQTHSLIFTSATLSVAQNFDVLKQRIGLNLIDAERVVELILPEAYSLAQQMRIFVTSDMPEPNNPAYIGELAQFLRELHRLTKGGVLTLFTNRKDMSQAHKLVAPILKSEQLELMVQNTNSFNLVNSMRFIEEPNTSLFALKSFWEGFDAKGDTLRCVVVPKIPFSQPGTSLAKERNLRYGAAAWRTFDLPDAILELKQAVGRLVRSSTDRGHIVLGDSRITTKGYGKTILRSLPVEAQLVTQQEALASIAQEYEQGFFTQKSVVATDEGFES